MSLTILSQPMNSLTGSTTLQSANNDSWFTVSGTTLGSSGVTEYKYVADVYVNTVLSATLKSFPDPATGFGVFNMRNVANNFVSYDFPLAENDTAVFNKAPNSWCNTQLFFREEYLSGSTFLAPTGTTNSNIVTYIDSALEYGTNVGISWIQYQMTSAPVGNFLNAKQNIAEYPFNNSQTPFYAFTDLHQWLYYWNSGETVLAAYIETYDAFLNPINTYTISNPYHTDSDEMQIVGTGIPELSGTVDFTNVGYYDVSLINNTPASSHIISQRVRYQILENCGRFAPGSYKLYWLDQFGEFNSFYFNKKNVTTVNKTQSTYKKYLGQVNSAGTVVQSTYDRSIIPFYTALQESTVLSTDFLQDADVLFLKGIFRSPVVFMQDENGTITNVTVSQDSLVLNKKVNQKAYAMQLTVQTSISDYAQLQ